MAKYEQIMDGPWINSTLFPESIPHLLHYDLAYLWVLEKQDDQRPTIWDEELKAWRCLVELLLTGELEIREEAIRDPLRRYTEMFGITKVIWLSLRNSEVKIGVLSPTVLVRPLPDFTTSDLKQWQEALSRNRRPDEFRFFVELTIKELEIGQTESSFRNKLARILAKEFLGLESAGRGLSTGSISTPPAGTTSISLPVPFLRHLLWTRTSDEVSCLEDVDLLIRGNGVAGKVYVPRCGKCNYLLTSSQDAQPIEVLGESIKMMCDNPAGRHENEVPLSNFLIWVRNESEAIIWNRQGILDLPTHGLPPEPKKQSIQLEFEWSGAQLGGERRKRFFKLLFPEKTLVERKIDEILFKKVLVPGKFGEFIGLPLRPEWLDAVKNLDQIRPEPESSTSKLVYRNIDIKGWPVPISRTFSGSLMVHQEPELGVGIYPNPQFVPDKWQWYRMFLHGSKRQSYKIQMESVKQILPWLHESTSGLRDSRTGVERSFSVVASSDKNIGVTFSAGAQHKAPSSSAPARINLGIDFGTTNTIIYFLPPGKNLDDVKNNPKEFCLEPSKSYLLAQWLADIDSPQSKTVGDFLPGPAYLKDRLDPYIVPSELWAFDEKFLIRWGPEEPHPQASLKTGFKWDDKGVERPTERNAYMKELLFLALPSILKSAFDSGSITTWDLNIHLGFTFPLSFGGADRQSAINLHNEIRDELGKLTNFKFHLHSINESSACMILLGSPNSNDTFLVADMGGGTIDLALFTAKNSKADQIGSIRFAGQTYLDILTKKRSLNQQDLRDLIAQGKCHYHYAGDNVAQLLLRRFIGMAFEFLRTMVAAYRKHKPDQNIHIVLAGNGWHLVEAFDEQTQRMTRKQVFNQYYDYILDLIGDKQIERADPWNQLDSNKHLVAIGALKQAVNGGYELNADQAVAPQLPAGRGLKFGEPAGQRNEINWSDLIGGQVPFRISSEDFREADIHIDFEDMPPLPIGWRTYLLGFFGVKDEKDIPRPGRLAFQEQIRNAMSKGEPPSLYKGPLQIILENRWVEWLKE